MDSKITMVQNHINVYTEESKANLAGELLCVLRSHSVVVPFLSCDILHATTASFWFHFQFTRGNGGKKLISLNRRLQSWVMMRITQNSVSVQFNKMPALLLFFFFF